MSKSLNGYKCSDCANPKFDFMLNFMRNIKEWVAGKQ